MLAALGYVLIVLVFLGLAADAARGDVACGYKLPLMTPTRTAPLSVHRDRSVAREEEDRVQAILDSLADAVPARRLSRLDHLGIPGWARGVRVERVGFFRRPPELRDERGVLVRPRRRAVQWVVVATTTRGH